MDKKQNEGRASKLPPIPTPVEIRWREFRSVWLAPIIFIAVAFFGWRLWTSMPPISPVQGVGEGPTSIIASPHDGFIQNIAVPHRGWIEAGDALATIAPYDPASQLDLIQSRLQLSRMAMEPTLSDRSALDFERLRVDALQLRQELAMARVNLEQAETVLPRHKALLDDQLIARDVYDETLRNRNFYRAEVEEKSKALEEIQARMSALEAFSSAGALSTNQNAQAIVSELQMQVEGVETNWNPVSLVAPISGEVQYLRQAGEFVRAGEQLLTINASRADRIIAYLKQPLPFEPVVGMRVEVVTRRPDPIKFETAISQVGARLEVLTNSIAYVTASALVDTALPLVLPVPENVQVHPGEVVDVIWRKIN